MKHLAFILFVTGFIWNLPLDGQAQLLEVKQTVYGMDCAPCAYALENRINKLEGITSVSVSLNDGLLTAALTDENALTLKQIRKAVEESGFSAKKAEIKVSGTVQKEKGQYVISTPSGDKYLLEFDNSKTEERLKSIQAGENITLAGLISQEEIPETEYWTLAVDKI